ncbi:hypothetical protein DPMN_057252 [Dreissena polymorpha]|uniref:G-protein coupled receptors family 1 profile domain-containing protein n=1 Tax=Dreissena polymorpha TaxID=45954 RepID=A0A9D4HTZ7_DREPO|nr:hypothetical protein DPMN_057252 [Dreissena polymorpha]
MINEKMIFIIAIFVYGFFHSCFAFVPVIIAEFSGHWFVHMSEASCVYEAFVNYYCGTSSMFYHVCITFRRYLGIVALPLNNAPIEKWRVALAFAGCQLLSLVLAISPLLGFGSYGLEAHGTSCGLAWNDRSSTGKAYLIGIGTVCYVLPVTITSIVYVLIIKTIRVLDCALLNTLYTKFVSAYNESTLFLLVAKISKAIDILLFNDFFKLTK